MKSHVITALRVVIALALLGSVFVQTVMLTLAWRDIDDIPLAIRIPVIAIFFLEIVALQVIAVCIWKLLGLVRKGTVFSSSAFKYVDMVIGAIFAISALIVGHGIAFARLNHLVPGDEVAPGMIALIGGFALVVAGVALVVLVMRALLAQAVRRDAEATAYKSELDEVI
ncbi:DUF2975 domain-containing protein [Timonella senegalensis]|uniref:DUF2975 domain-containing protein n=1 Tax=Timonella senegalensis TaxID=1465825 RepID=UPI000317B512|nr:DUF2975 domain-containing protein [Timonella senegalensis]